MKAWLLLVAAFLLWPGCFSQNECEEPDEIDFGEIVSAEKAKYLENDRVQYRCSPSYVLEGPEWIQCKRQEWTPPPPKCLAPCSITRQQLAAKHLFVFGSQRKARLIQSNQSLQFQCNEGYVLMVPSIRKCVDGYMDLPLCISDIEGGCGHPPTVDNGDIMETLKETYVQSESVTYQCQNLYIMEGSARVTCQNGHWSQTPVCKDIGEKCGRPPPVDNGDIVDSFKAIYLQSETVIYQCQNFYTMQGSARVTCQNGRWSQTPICRVPCTASEEDMREHNIKLKWSNGNKLYAKDGNVVEFVCLRGYKPHPNTRSLRVNCMDGKFDYPDCIPI